MKNSINNNIDNNGKKIDDIKNSLNCLENEYLALDASSDSARKSMKKNEIWINLSEYFNNNVIKRKTLRHFENLSQAEKEDILQDCLLKAIKLLDKYNPANSKNSSFTTFLEKCINNYLNDYGQKIKREYELFDHNTNSNTEDTDNTETELEKNTNFQIQNHSEFEEADNILNYLQNFSNTILEFLNHQGKKYNDTRKLYYRVFYSERLLNFIKSGQDEYNPNWYPEHILDAYLFKFSDYLLLDKCRTILEIYNSNLRTYNELLNDNNNNIIKFPLSAKILINYFNTVEQKKTSNANISQFKKDFDELLGNLL